MTSFVVLLIKRIYCCLYIMTLVTSTVLLNHGVLAQDLTLGDRQSDLETFMSKRAAVNQTLPTTHVAGSGLSLDGGANTPSIMTSNATTQRVADPTDGSCDLASSCYICCPQE